MKQMLFILLPFFLLAQPSDGHIQISVYGNTGFWPCTKYENLKVLAFGASYALKQNPNDEYDFDFEKPNLKALKFLGEFKCLSSKEEFKDYPLESFYFDSCMKPNLIAIIQNKDTMYVNTASTDACFDWMIDGTGAQSYLPFIIRFKKGLFQLRDIAKDKERITIQNSTYLDYLLKFQYSDRFYKPNYLQNRIVIFETSRTMYEKDDFVFIRFQEDEIIKKESSFYRDNRHVYWALQKLNKNNNWEIIVPSPLFEFEDHFGLSDEDPKLKIIPLFQYKWDKEKLNYQQRDNLILPSGIFRLVVFDDLAQPYFSNEFTLK